MSSTFFRLDKILVNLEYEGRIISAKIAPYKTIRFMRDLSKNLFYPIPYDIRLLYMNKDLSQYDTLLVGDYFKNKNKINIKVIPLESNSSLNSNELLHKKDVNFSGKSDQYLCQCKKGVISNYCRACKTFFCDNCCKNLAHSSHKIIQVDVDNFEESTKLYAITLQSDILFNIKTSKDYLVKYKQNQLLPLNTRQDMIIRKLNKIYNLYCDMIDSLGLDDKKYENIEALINQYEVRSKPTNEELENILSLIYNKYTKPKDKMGLDDFKGLFKILSQKENELNEISYDLLSFRVQYDIRNKLENMYDRIENILDEVLNSSIPLGLDQNTYYIYDLIRRKNHPNKVRYFDGSGNEIINNHKPVKTKIFIKAKEKKDNDCMVNKIIKEKYSLSNNVRNSKYEDSDLSDTDEIGKYKVDATMVGVKDDEDGILEFST